MAILMYRRIILIFLCLCIGGRALPQAWTVYNSSNSGLPFNAVNCIAFEAGGLKWIGTESGLASFDDTTWTVYNTSNSGLPDNAVRSLLIDESNNKWVGTFLGGLAKFDGTNWTVYDALNTPLPDNFIKALALDTAGNKWIGTIQGLVRYDDSTFAVYDFSNAPFQLSDNIADIHIDTANVFTIGTLNGGLIRIMDTMWTVYTIPNGSGIPDNTQLEVEIDDNGMEWMATPANGLVAHPGGLTWLVYNPFTSNMPSYAASSLELLSNPDRVWVGTYDKGVVRKDGLVFTHFDNTNSPFPDVFASAITQDSAGILWMGSPSGLVRLDESLLTGLDPVSRETVLLYPSPASHEVRISSPVQLGEARIYTLEGRHVPVQFNPVKTGIFAADVSGLGNGVYVVRMHFRDGTIVIRKMIKGGSR